MSVPISSFASSQVQPNGRLTPVGRASSAGFRTNSPERDTDTVIHLSDEARAILAGTLLPSEEVTVVPVHEPADAPASDEAREADPQAQETESAEYERIFEPRAGKSGEAQTKPTSPFVKERTPEQERAIQQLQARDTEVRAHEAAHAAAAGSLGGRPSLDYVVGPDGRRYAVGGEVSVDTSPGRTPEETITKARTIRAAATAPASPSAQDMAVAAAATRMESQAQDAIRERRQFESRARAERASAASTGTDTVRPVQWSRVGATKDAGAANSVQEQVQAQAAEPAAARSVVQDLAAPDPEMMMLQLVREQLSSRGGMGHTHLSAGCGFCRRAAATYA